MVSASFILVIILIPIITNISTLIKGIYIGGFFLLFHSFMECYIPIFRSREKMVYESFMFFVEKLTILVVSIIFIIQGRGILFLIFAYALGSLLSFILGSIIVHIKFQRIKLYVDFRIYKKLFTHSLPFFFSSSISQMMGRVTSIFLFLFGGITAVAYFEAGYRFVEKLAMFPDYYAASVFPQFSKLFKKSKIQLKKLYQQSFKISFYLNSFILSFLTIFAEFLILFFYGQEFTNSVNVLRLAAISGFLFFHASISSRFLNAVNKEKMNAIFSLIGIILLIFFCLLLIPSFSYYGAIIALRLTYSIIYTFKLLYILYFFKNRKIS